MKRARGGIGLLLLTSSALATCVRAPSSTPPDAAPVAAPAAVPPSEPSEAEREMQRCRDARARIESLPALPGAPAFEARRGEILLRARVEPLVFLATPGGEANARVDRVDTAAARRRHRRHVARASRAAIEAIKHAARKYRRAPALLRNALLREGYLYADDPDVAAVLVGLARVEALFREPDVFVLHGADTLHLARNPHTGLYAFVDGPQRGEPAILHLGDRVGTDRAALLPALHRDLGTLVRSEGVERVRFVRITHRGALAQLRYDGHWVPAVLDDDGQRYRVLCVRADETAVIDARRDAVGRGVALERIRAAVRDMVHERLRFDEPLEEVGQQDGSLRPLWRLAYLRGSNWYGFNGHGYAVFDARGRPVPPQVCVDFVLDAYERASGTWFAARGAPRARVRGSIDFDDAGMDNRRSASQLVAFAQAHPEAFDVWTPAPAERVPFGRTGEFYASVRDHAERFHPGDVVVIHGLRADGKAHYHTFLVDAVDPISGVPYQLAGNAGRPRLQTWAGVMWSAPRRSIRYVLSPRTAWLVARLGAAQG